MSETNAKSWGSGFGHAPHLLDFVRHRSRIARSIRKVDTIWLHREHFVRAGCRRNNSDAATGTRQLTQRIALHPKVIADNVKALETLRCNLVRLFSGDDTGQLAILHRW